MNSAVRNTIYKPLVEGTFREIVTGFQILLPEGVFGASALVSPGGGGFQFEVHCNRSSLPDALLPGSRRVFTIDDTLTLKGSVAGKIEIKADDVFPALRTSTNHRGQSTLLFQSNRIHLPPEGLDLVDSASIATRLRGGPVQESNIKKGGEAHVIFHGPMLRLKNGRTENRKTNDFLGDASSATLDTFTFESESYEGALIQDGQELHLHLRSRSEMPFTGEQWTSLVKRIELCVGFTHGFHPWPIYREVRLDHVVQERWIGRHLNLDQTGLSPICKSMEFDVIDRTDTPLARIIPTLEMGLSSCPAKVQSGLRQILWYSRATEISELPPTTKLLMACTTLDAVMKLLAGQEDPNKSAKTNRVWKEGVTAAGLSWDDWGVELFDCYGKHRHHLAHGWLLLPEDKEQTAFFDDYPRLVAGLGTVIAAHCSYDGPIVSNSYSGSILEIASIRSRTSRSS